MRLKQLGRYEIIDELGRGAMGVVYKAKDPLIGRTVAIKTIDIGRARVDSDAFEKRFEREARSAGRLNHPNIVTIYDVGQFDDIAYIAMEFLDGQTLREILDSGVVLPPATIAGIAAQVADGLAFAHQHGVIHRDIKPANLIVVDGGVVKIMDFGIAKLPTGAGTVAGPVFGSPKYISPEQVVGRPVDARSDVFSLGAVLYELLTGVPPFPATELDEILHQVINAKPALPSSRNRSLPVAFDGIVTRALAKHPSDRYQNARDMAADLRKLSGEGAPAAPEAVGIPAPARADPTVKIAHKYADTLPDFTIEPDEIIPREASRARLKLMFYGAAATLLLVAGIWGLVTSRSPSANQAQKAIAEPTIVTAQAVPAASEAPPRAEAAPIVASTAQPTNSAPPENVAAAGTLNAQSAGAGPLAAEKPMARLGFAVTPWGEVYVDGHKRGVSPPLQEIRLAPGKHTIEIRNTTFEPHVETVDLRAETNVKVKHKFQ